MQWLGVTNTIVVLGLAIGCLRRETGGDWSRLLPATPAALACAAATAGAFTLVALAVGFMGLRLAGVSRPARVRLPIVHTAALLVVLVVVAFNWALEPVDPTTPFTTLLFGWWDFVSGAAAVVSVVALITLSACWWLGSRRAAGRGR